MTKQEVIHIPDPELLLPDEQLTPAYIYRAESAFIGKDYVSLQALIRQRSKVEAHFNAEMADWQRAIAAPTYVMYAVTAGDQRMEVYAYIPTPTGLMETDRAAGVEESRKRRIIKKLESAHQRGWLYGRWHSRTQPLGEYGVMHRSLIQRVLTEAEFIELGQKGWVIG